MRRRLGGALLLLLLALAAEGAMGLVLRKPGNGSLAAPANVAQTWALWTTWVNDGLGYGTIGTIPFSLKIGPPVGQGSDAVGGYRLQACGGVWSSFSDPAYFGPGAPATTLVGELQFWARNGAPYANTAFNTSLTFDNYVFDPMIRVEGLDGE